MSFCMFLYPLQGRRAVIPNQGLLINTISLQEAKASSEIEVEFFPKYTALMDKL